MRRSGPSEIKSFRADQEKTAAWDYKSRGVRLVPLNRIVGSVGKYHDFDNRFQLKPHLPAERLERIKAEMRKGRGLPPVDLYQINDEFYVLDGNHRVAAAKALGHGDIYARIMEFIPTADTFENILYREREAFYEKTGLPQFIDLSEVGQYARLADQIAGHHAFLEQGGDKKVSFEEAARDWYDTIYCPLKTIIQRGRLVESFPERTVSDLYAYISYHQWETSAGRRYGIGINERVPRDMEEFRKKMGGLKEAEYPEMKRIITAFVLMNIKASRETQILDKLFSLDEVKEVHSVHGDVDVLVKFVLTRDLLSSDAEIISDFIHRKIRQIRGVISTRTLIPGMSRMKPPALDDDMGC